MPGRRVGGPTCTFSDRRVQEWRNRYGAVPAFIENDLFGGKGATYLFGTISAQNIKLVAFRIAHHDPVNAITLTYADALCAQRFQSGDFILLDVGT